MTLSKPIPTYATLRMALGRVTGVSRSAAERILEAGLPYAHACADGGSLQSRRAWAHSAIRFAVSGLPRRVAVEVLMAVARGLPGDEGAPSPKRVPAEEPSRRSA